jgi:hypothetical protein
MDRRRKEKRKWRREKRGGEEEQKNVKNKVYFMEKTPNMIINKAF